MKTKSLEKLINRIKDDINEGKNLNKFFKAQKSKDEVTGVLLSFKEAEMLIKEIEEKCKF